MSLSLQQLHCRYEESYLACEIVLDTLKSGIYKPRTTSFVALHKTWETLEGIRKYYLKRIQEASHGFSR